VRLGRLVREVAPPVLGDLRSGRDPHLGLLAQELDEPVAPISSRPLVSRCAIRATDHTTRHSLLEVVRPGAVAHDPRVEGDHHVPRHAVLAFFIHERERVLEVLEVVGTRAPSLAGDVEAEVSRVERGGDDEQAFVRLGRGEGRGKPELTAGCQRRLALLTARWGNGDSEARAESMDSRGSRRRTSRTSRVAAHRGPCMLARRGAASSWTFVRRRSLSTSVRADHNTTFTASGRSTQYALHRDTLSRHTHPLAPTCPLGSAAARQ
jgi:hypothetical protein